MATFTSFWSKLDAISFPKLRIGFSDSSDPRVREAAEVLKAKNQVEPVLIEKTSEQDRPRFLSLLSEKQKKLNLSQIQLEAQLDDPLYNGVCLLLENRIDALVAGSLRPTADIVKAALQCIGPKEGVKLVSGHFLIESDRCHSQDQTPFLFADCAIIPEPSPRALAATALAAASSYRFFTKSTPKVAFLSFSTRDSAQHPLVDRIKEALEITRKHDANLIVDGELQVDAALNQETAVIKKANNSFVAGKANVLIFPTLESGNIGYKLLQQFSSARVAGPLLWGLDKPMSDLSRGCTVQEIVDTALCVGLLSKGLN